MIELTTGIIIGLVGLTASIGFGVYAILVNAKDRKDHDKLLTGHQIMLDYHEEVINNIPNMKCALRKFGG